MIEFVRRQAPLRLASWGSALASLVCWIAAWVVDGRYESVLLVELPDCILQQTCTREDVDRAAQLARGFSGAALLFLVAAMIIDILWMRLLVRTGEQPEARPTDMKSWIVIGSVCLLMPGFALALAVYALLNWTLVAALGVLVLSVVATSAVTIAMMRPARNHVAHRVICWLLPLVVPLLGYWMVNTTSYELVLLSYPVWQIAGGSVTALVAHVVSRAA